MKLIIPLQKGAVKRYLHGEKTVVKKRYGFQDIGISKKEKPGEPQWHETLRQKEYHRLPEGMQRKLPENINIEDNKTVKHEQLLKLHKQGKIKLMHQGVVTNPHSAADNLRHLQEHGKTGDFKRGKVVKVTQPLGREMKGDYYTGYFHKSIMFVIPLQKAMPEDPKTQKQLHYNNYLYHDRGMMHSQKNNDVKAYNYHKQQKAAAFKEFKKIPGTLVKDKDLMEVEGKKRENIESHFKKISGMNSAEEMKSYISGVKHPNPDIHKRLVRNLKEHAIDVLNNRKRKPGIDKYGRTQIERQNLSQQSQGMFRRDRDVMKVEGKKGLKQGKNITVVDPKQLKMGIKVEAEHTNDKTKARRIALDHLAEDPKYYSKLARVGL